MRIEKLVLNNFGSYEGETIFDTNASSGKNIILIGGKNGAGKTTLFTAMRLCLYGYMSMGYKNYNSFYTRALTKLINNNAKMVKPAFSHVSISISLSNGQGLDYYDLIRSWILDDSLTEQFKIIKNGITLSEDEVPDFEKYLLSLIPPELFNLYFFDGEKIADFFMNEGSSTRIKEAFLTLCGYDTFDIMRRNFKRISGGNSTSSEALDEYWDAKNLATTEQAKYNELVAQITSCIEEIEICDADIAALDKSYTISGGIRQDEWSKKVIQLRDEEKKRDTWNALLRKWSNEIIPFLMIREQIIALKEQISKEADSQKYKNFCEILEHPQINSLIVNQAARIRTIARENYGSSDEQILDLSLEQSAILLGQIGVILSFDADKVAKCKRSIKKSISLSAKIRQELDSSNIASVQEYMKTRSTLLEHKAELLEQQIELEHMIAEQKAIADLAELALNKTQTKLETELKKASINDISAKAIVMLDKLQNILYRQQIKRVEDSFRKEIKTLMRKAHFIDDIEIDDNFNISLYRYDPIDTTILQELLSDSSGTRLIDALGRKAFHELQAAAGSDSLEEIRLYCSQLSSSLRLPLQIDQTALSNGEKQIFIMTLYHSLVKLSRHEIPFIIDTPFARIDTEHRRNISRFFFSRLQGQVFILSTNEEINSEHIQIMEDRIAATYLLENTGNKGTTVVQSSYFEV